MNPITIAAVQRAVACLMVAGGALASGAAAQEAPLAQVEVAGLRYAAYRAEAEVVAAPLPLSARLWRDASQPPPACAALDVSLAPFAATIDACKAEPGGNACEPLNELVAALREDPGTIGASSLSQSWLVTPTALSADATVAEQLASELGTRPSDVLLPSSAALTGAAEVGTAVVDPAGTSWASRLIGLGAAERMSLTPDATGQSWLSQDQVLACGILAGDVTLAWVQETRLELRAAPIAGALGAEQWPQVYAAVALASPGAASSPVQRALAIGRALGDALVAVGVEDAALPARAASVLDAMFVDAALTEVRELQDIDAANPPPRDPPLELRLAWQARAAEQSP